MKKTFTILIAALMLLAMINMPQMAKGQAAANTTLWSEDFSGFTVGDAPTGSIQNSHTGTTVYGGVTLTYSFTNGATNTKIYDASLAGGTSPELLISKKDKSHAGGTFSVSGISTGSAVELTLTYKENYDYTSVTTSTEDVVISDKSYSSSTATYTITTNGASTLALTFTNTNSSNVRIDNISLKVSKVKLSSPTNLSANPGNAQATFSWDAVTNASKYTLSYQAEGADSWTTISNITNTSKTVDELDNGTKYFAKVKAVGNGTTYADSEFTSTVEVTPTSADYYNINIGSLTGGNVTTSLASAPEGTTITLTATPNPVSHTFTNITSNWSVIDEGDDPITVSPGIDNKATFTMPASDVTVTATFTEKSKFNVTYDKNYVGEPSGSTVDENSPYYDGTTVTVLANGFTRLGYRFIEWNTESEGGGIDLDPGATFTIGAHTTLYAQWIQTHTVTLHSNGITTTLTKDHGSKFDLSTKPINIPVGYSFRGWATDPENASSTMVSENPTINDDNTELYAVYKKLVYGNYSMITSTGDITSGLRYLIVCGSQNVIFKGSLTTLDATSNNVSVTISTNTITRTDAIDLNSFVITKYTVEEKSNYEEKTYYNIQSASGYYIGKDTSGNGLNQSTSTVYDNTITFSSNNVLIKSKDYTSLTLQYNKTSGQERFRYFGSAQEAVQLYRQNVTDDNGYHVDIDDAVANADITITNPTIISSGSVLNMGSHKLTNTTAANLIIEDGGQLVTSNAVKATFKKNIDAGALNSNNNWYLISSPVGEVNTNAVTNLLGSGYHKYNLYLYDETTAKWKSDGSDAGNFTALNVGQGYLYRNNDGADLTYSGTIKTGDIEDISLTKTGSGTLAGFNLLGNPYAHNITSKFVTLSSGSISGCYTLKTDGTWLSGLNTEIKPGEGFFIQVGANATATIHETDQSSKYNNEYIQFMVKNSQYEDVTFALFDKGVGLNKLNHRNADVPMLYIPQNGEDYAIAMMEDDVEMFGLSFKAATTGKYTLSFDTKGEFSYLHVIDRFNNEDVDMLLDGEYSFIGSPQDSEARFIVKLGYKPNYSTEGNDNFAYQTGNEILVSGEGTLQVFDMMGRFVMSTEINGVKTINSNELSKGVYVLRIVGSEVKTQKIIIK